MKREAGVEKARQDFVLSKKNHKVTASNNLRHNSGTCFDFCRFYFFLPLILKFENLKLSFAFHHIQYDHPLRSGHLRT